MTVTLSLAPEFPAVVTETRRAVQTAASTGYVQRRQVQSSTSRQSGEQAIRVWQVEWRKLTPTQRTSLQAAFDAAIGRSFAVNFRVPFTLSTVEVKFLSDSLEIAHVSGQMYSARVSLEEVI